MKVKELIEELKKLDQEKGIWILYDYFAILEPIPDVKADEEAVEMYGKHGMELGDYIINVG